MATSRQRRASSGRTTSDTKTGPLKVSTQAVMRSRVKPQRDSQAAVDPFAPAHFPPSVVGGKGGMALDAALPDQAWAAAAYQGHAFSEGIAFLGYPYLALLAQRGEYRRIVETIATEMTRKWIRVVSRGEEDKSDRIEAIEAAMKRLNVRDAFRKVAEQDGNFGRAHLHIDIDGGDGDEERKTPIGNGSGVISRTKVTKGSLQGVRPVEPYWCAPNPTSLNTTNPLGRDFYRPDAWNVMGRQIHGSRLLTFIGREVPDVLKAAYGFGGLSMVQMAKPYVDNWLKTRESVSDLIASFSVSGVKGMDLVAALASGGEALDNLFNRIEVFNNLRDNRGFMALNGEEEFFNVTTQLGTLDKLQAQSQEHIASVCGIPLVKLLGIQPSGLNASSDGEIRVFYDSIHAYQEKFFSPNLDRVFRFIQLSEFGEVDEAIGYEYEPLWQMSDKEKAEVAAARTTAVMAAEPILPTPTVLRELREMSDATGVFTQITDDDIEEAESAPPPPETGLPDADADTSTEPLSDQPQGVPRLLEAAE